MLCAALTCDRAAVERGWCHKHYQRWRRHGDVEVRDSPRSRRLRHRTIDDVMSSVMHLQRTETGCILWPGGKDEKGYGWVRVNGHRTRAHRVALQWRLGRPLGPGLAACHTCDTPSCVNPDHLWEGTIAENNADRIAKLRASGNELAECPDCGKTVSRLGLAPHRRVHRRAA